MWPWSLTSRRDARGLTGDMRPLNFDQSAQLIDATWPEPRAILVTGDSSDPLLGANWTLTYSIERGQINQIGPVTGFKFHRLVIARAVQLHVAGSQGVVRANAIALEAHVGVDALAAALEPFSPVTTGPPLASTRGSVAVVGPPPAGTILAVEDNARRFLTISNFSPAARYLMVNLNGLPPITAGDADYFVPPNSTLEIDGREWSGIVTGAWTGVDAAGFANVNIMKAR